MLNLLAERCTFYFIVACLLSMAAVAFSRSEGRTHAWIWYFSIGWLVAAVDAVQWIVDAFRSFGAPNAAEVYWGLTTSLLSLVVPLCALVAICLMSRPAQPTVGRGAHILCAACCVVLIDLIFLLVVCGLFGWALATRGL